MSWLHFVLVWLGLSEVEIVLLETLLHVVAVLDCVSNISKGRFDILPPLLIGLDLVDIVILLIATGKEELFIWFEISD